MYGILFTRLGWCSQVLLGIVRKATKTNMQNCWSFTCCFSWALGSLLKCDQKFFLYVLLWQMFFRTGSTGSTLFFWRGSSRYSDRLHVTITRCYKDVYVNGFFPCTARLWNSMPIECFPLTYNLNGFKPTFNRHLLTVGHF